MRGAVVTRRWGVSESPVLEAGTAKELSHLSKNNLSLHFSLVSPPVFPLVCHTPRLCLATPPFHGLPPACCLLVSPVVSLLALADSHALSPDLVRRISPLVSLLHGLSPRLSPCLRFLAPTFSRLVSPLVASRVLPCLRVTACLPNSDLVTDCLPTCHTCLSLLARTKLSTSSMRCHRRAAERTHNTEKPHVASKERVPAHEARNPGRTTRPCRTLSRQRSSVPLATKSSCLARLPWPPLAPACKEKGVKELAQLLQGQVAKKQSYQLRRP